MKITAVDSFHLVVPYRTEGGFHFIAGRPSSGLAMVLVRVRTDTGLEGWGEAFGHGAAASTKAALDTLVGPFFIGRDPAPVQALMREAQHRMHIFGRSGPIPYALSGVDIALWDLAGKIAGKPLYQLLGAAPREDLPAYASLLRCSGLDAVAQSCQAALQSGVRHLKLHEITEPTVRAARQAIGPEIGLMLDTNCPWSVDEAIAMAEQLRPHDLYWLEEPVWPPEDYVGLARVRATGAITSAGENVASPTEFAAMLEVGAVEVGQPSVCKIGGVTAMLAIFKLAAAKGVRIVPHCGYLGAGFLATVHLTANLPGSVLVERLSIDVEGNPFGAWPDVVGGRVRVPQGPGLGCDPDMALVERHVVS
jgi:D-galactarolactone cycloisomerase